MADGSRPVTPAKLPPATEFHLRARFGDESFSVDLRSPYLDALTDEKLAEYFGVMAVAIGFDPGAVAARMSERYER